MRTLIQYHPCVVIVDVRNNRTDWNHSLVTSVTHNHKSGNMTTVPADQAPCEFLGHANMDAPRDGMDVGSRSCHGNRPLTSRVARPLRTDTISARSKESMWVLVSLRC